MPLATNNARPSIPYVPSQVLPNYNRYSALGKFAPTAEQFDGDCNWFTDQINALCEAINNVAAGILPGAEIPANAHKFPVTDGANHISWTLVQAINVANLAIGTPQLANLSITPDKIQPQAVTRDKLYPKVIDSTKADDEFLEEQHFSEKCLPGKAYQDTSIPKGAFIPGLIASTLLTALEEIQDGVCEVGGVLTAINQEGEAQFRDLPLAGKILQIKSTTIKTQSTVTGAIAFTEFSTPLSVSITTKAANSIVLVFLSANLLCGYSQNSHILYPQTLFYALFKNGVLWPAASGTAGTNQTSGLGQVRVYDYQQVSNISSLISEVVPGSGTTNIYSLRALCGADYYVMMNSQLPDDGQGNFSGVASLSTLYAIEIGG